MNIKVFKEHDSTRAVLYCTTKMISFGPVFASSDDADDFLTWCDERKVTLPSNCITTLIELWEDEHNRVTLEGTLIERKLEAIRTALTKRTVRDYTKAQHRFEELIESLKEHDGE